MTGMKALFLRERDDGPRGKIRTGLFYLFCGSFFVLPMGTSPFTILGVCVLILWVLSGEIFRQNWLFLRDSWIWPVLVLAALSWVGLLFSPDPHGLGMKYAGKSHYWLYTLALAGLPLSQENREGMIRCLLAGLAVNAMIGCFQFLDVLPTFYPGRFTGLSTGYGTLAILLNFGILVSSYYFRVSTGLRTKVVYLFLTGLYFLHLALLEGRGGYLVFALLSPLVVYNLSRGRHRVITFLLFLLAIALMSSSPIVQDKVVRTINDMKIQFSTGKGIRWGKHYSEDERLQRIDRVYMWRWAVDLFLQHPLTGVGTGGFKRAILAGGGERGIDHPHNNFLYVAVSFGLGGLLALGWYFFTLLLNGWRCRHTPLGFMVFSSGLVIFLGGLVDTPILDSGSAFFLAIATGMQAFLHEAASM